MREVPKKPIFELTPILNNLARDYPVGTRWRHHSGDHYRIAGYSIDCKTNKGVLHYNKIEEFSVNEVVFSRPAEDFVEPRFEQTRQANLWLTVNQLKEIKDKILK